MAAFLLHLYQHIVSPFLPANTCRFYPSCSQYALEAFERHTIARAILLTLKRILRCHPYNPGGYDPVPSNLKKK